MLLLVNAFTFEMIFLSRFLVKTSTAGLTDANFFNELSESPKMLISSTRGKTFTND